MALLEVMVHLDSYALLRHYRLFRVEIPDEAIEVLPPEDLPENWRDDAPPEDTALVGNAWLEREDPGLALAVPSVIVPREVNYILNPTHPAYERIVGEAQEMDFEPDPRLIAE